MSNLLRETKEVIDELEYLFSDIVFIGSQDGKYGMSWPKFRKLADKDYGGPCSTSPKVAMDLVIVFKNGVWLSRTEYDGGEYWQVNKPPKVSRKYKTPVRIIGNYWPDFERLHDPAYEGHNYIAE